MKRPTSGKLDQEVKIAAEEISRLFLVKEKGEGWECQAYYLFEAFKRLTSDEQLKAQRNAGEITFNASTGFPITGWWAGKGVKLSNGGMGMDAKFSFVPPPSEETAKGEYTHGRYVNDDVLEFYLLAVAYESDKALPTTPNERRALLKEIQKQREATKESKEKNVDKLKSRLAEVQREVNAARRKSNFGELCNEACLPTGAACPAGEWLTQYKGSKDAGMGQPFCELLYDQGALKKKDTPADCAAAIKKCPANAAKIKVDDAKSKVEKNEADLKNMEQDLENLSERIETLEEDARSRKTGDSRKSSDRRVKPGSDPTTSETDRRTEGTPAE